MLPGGAQSSLVSTAILGADGMRTGGAGTGRDGGDDDGSGGLVGDGGGGSSAGKTMDASAEGGIGMEEDADG